MTAIEQVFQHIKTNPSQLPSQIAAALPDVNRSTVYGAIDNLWLCGEIQRFDSGDGFRYFVDTTNGSDPMLAELEKHASVLEEKGHRRRAAEVWLAAFDAAKSVNDRERYRQRRLRCLAGMTKGNGDESCVAGRYVGGNDA
ncbi:PerC family transcriptional regulator [Escherichia coli]|nr:PerC family transcriptional regulator [Escherichia coli]